MGLNRFYHAGMVGIYFRMEESFTKGRDIHKKLRSMSNAKVEISNQIVSLKFKYWRVLKLAFLWHLVLNIRSLFIMVIFCRFF
jgi:hypothetical protein